MAEDVKEIKISVPEGYEIDKKNSTFECIKFKKKEEKPFRGSNVRINGFYINDYSKILKMSDAINDEVNRNVFATEEQAQSALAMAQISQIIANDERFGGCITNAEWRDPHVLKYTIHRFRNSYNLDNGSNIYSYLAFHKREQRHLFMKENEDLVKQYLMIV